MTKSKVKQSFEVVRNHEISMAGAGETETMEWSPEALANKALELCPCGNIVVACTYQRIADC